MVLYAWKKPILRGRSFRIVKEPAKWSGNLRKMLKISKIARAFANHNCGRGINIFLWHANRHPKGHLEQTNDV